MREFAQDLRYGLRTLARSPGFTVVAVLTLALGIGATSAIFSFVDGVLLKPLPYPDADRIVVVAERPPGGSRNPISTLNFLDWQAANDVFEHLAAITGGSVAMTGTEEPIRLRGRRVSASYFSVYGVEAAIGRTFAPGDDEPGREHVVVLSHRLWQSRFGGDPAIVGRAITLNREPHTVIGVLPETSAFDRGYAEIWRPLAFSPAERTRDYHWLQAIGRLKPGVALDEARAEMDAIGARIARDHPDSNRDWGVTVLPYGDSLVGDELRRSLYVLLAAVGMMLLVGCVNIANLTLARGAMRTREVAVRAAMGAGRGRLLRQFLTESLLVALAGGLAGVGLGYAMVGGLRALLPPFTLPREAVVTMDARVLAFALAVSVATGLAFGLVPALQATRTDLASTMKEGGRGAGGDAGRRRLRGALVVAETALAFALLVGAGLLTRSFFLMMRADLGFDRSNVMTMGLPVDSDRFADAGQLAGYLREVVAHVSAVPGVRSAAVASVLPLEGWGYGMPFQIHGRDLVDRANRPACFFKMVSPSYFATLGLTIVRGRGLTDADRAGAPPVTIISQTMASRFFEHEDPIGQRILIQEIVPGRRELGPEIPWEVVGVAADEQVGGPDTPAYPGVYVPMDQSPTTGACLLARGEVDAATLAASIQHAVREIDRDQILPDARTIEQILGEATASDRLRTLLIGTFATIALLLAAIGLYGVMAYSVARRTHELGMRTALGASTGSLLRMVVGEGLRLAGLGLVLGAAGSLALGRVLGSLLYEVRPSDPLTLAAAATTLLAVAVTASYVPARRAATLDPIAALRVE